VSESAAGVADRGEKTGDGQPDEEMRREVAALALAAASEHRPVYILVNNKAEGCAPLTIRALAEILAGETPLSS
jgi:hypothetical protein